MNYTNKCFYSCICSAETMISFQAGQSDVGDKRSILFTKCHFYRSKINYFYFNIIKTLLSHSK